MIALAITTSRHIKPNRDDHLRSFLGVCLVAHNACDHLAAESYLVARLALGGGSVESHCSVDR
jgi:hypothetical protein